MTQKKITLLILATAILTVGASAFISMRRASSSRRLEKADSPQDLQQLAAFRAKGRLERKDFEDLEAYFQHGFAEYRDETGSSASYPGLPSSHGHGTDSLEGFTRMAPLMAVYLRSQSQPDSAQAIQARQFLLEGWTNGSDPNSKGYWGAIADNDQRIVEASDVALSVWLLRDSLWLQLPSSTRDNVIKWMLQVNHRNVPDNNWHLFITFINLVASSVGYPADMQEARRHYERFKTFYRGDGWFSDGPGMRFDYYNAWGIDYQLFWIDQVDPTFDDDFIPNAINDFARQLQYLVGPNGLPIMGRSICYRMAVTTPLILAQNLPQPSVPPGVARRALGSTWEYFISKGGVRSGRITQGYCGFDARVLDSYSGPASCQWGLRSLIGALYLDKSSAFWTGPDEALPVERSNYTLYFPQPGWTVIGHKPDLIVIHTQSTKAPVALKAENPLLVLSDRITGKVHRPENEDEKYGLREYRSDVPYCGCALGH